MTTVPPCGAPQATTFTRGQSQTALVLCGLNWFLIPSQGERYPLAWFSKVSPSSWGPRGSIRVALGSGLFILGVWPWLTEGFRPNRHWLECVPSGLMQPCHRRGGHLRVAPSLRTAAAETALFPLPEFRAFTCWYLTGAGPRVRPYLLPSSPLSPRVFPD